MANVPDRADGDRRPKAELRVRGERRVFVATVCVVDGQLVHTVGRWRSRVGANYSDEHFSSEMSISFGVGEVERIKWMEHELASLDHSAEILGMP